MPSEDSSSNWPAGYRDPEECEGMYPPSPCVNEGGCKYLLTNDCARGCRAAADELARETQELKGGRRGQHVTWEEVKRRRRQRQLNRRAQYAAAISRECDLHEQVVAEIATAAMAVADREQQQLRADCQQLSDQADEWCQCAEQAEAAVERVRQLAKRYDMTDLDVACRIRAALDGVDDKETRASDPD